MTSHGGRAGFIALIAAFVVACGGTAPSTSPSLTSAPTTQAPSSGPTSTPASSLTGSDPSSSPSPDPTGTPAPQEGWVQLASASDASAVWSPDAQFILASLSTPGGPPESQQVQLLTRDGVVIRTHERLTDPVWLDPQSFVAYRLDWQQDQSGEWTPATGPNGERLGEALVGSVVSEQLLGWDIPLGSAISSGSGALAISRFDSGGRAETSVWTQLGGLTDWHAGAPLAWSPAGDRLALVHGQPTGPPGEGWLEVIAWPGLATLWSDESLTCLDGRVRPEWRASCLPGVRRTATGAAPGAGVRPDRECRRPRDGHSSAQCPLPRMATSPGSVTNGC